MVRWKNVRYVASKKDGGREEVDGTSALEGELPRRPAFAAAVIGSPLAYRLSWGIPLRPKMALDSQCICLALLGIVGIDIIPP